MSAEFTMSAIAVVTLTDSRRAQIKAALETVTDPYGDLEQEDYADVIREALDMYEQFDSNRQVVKFSPGNGAPDFYIAGGMSYGDPSSEAVEYIDRVSECFGEKFHQWAMEKGND